MADTRRPPLERTLTMGLVAGALLASPLVPAAGAVTTPDRGIVFGGITGQTFPVVVETSRDGRTVTRALVAIRLPCTAGGSYAVPDGYRAVTVQQRRFASGFGPETFRNDDGTSYDVQGSMTGTFNRSGTAVSGTWSLRMTDHDATGAVTDTCDSGTVHWTARQ
jgi:hypothetical protein